jgi:hypothetical protein
LLVFENIFETMKSVVKGIDQQPIAEAGTIRTATVSAAELV